MYREAEASLAADNARLRDEVRRLVGDADVMRRMTAPRRVLRLVAIAGVAFGTAVDVAAVYAVDRYRHELAELGLDDKVLGEELVQVSQSLDQAAFARDVARRELAALQPRCARLQALEEARALDPRSQEARALESPWLVEDRPGHTAGFWYPRTCAHGICP
jgi:hypothetical protein